MRYLELLAPAKDKDTAFAAVDSGADAVYMGAVRFGARLSAGNQVSDIAEVCDYAHLFGVRVYVTVNTIVYDHELHAVEELLGALKTIGVDAVIVQDWGVAQMAEKMRLVIHSSTQTDTRSANKVEWLWSHGYKRVVLARELSLAEISAIHSRCPEVELEAFVHGALCVSYSGLCYASQYCFRRSANRGECAQFCRLPFDLTDAGDKVVIGQKHLLSLKDMNRLDYIQEMAEAGVSSFKIEGRLKDVSYVRNVTAAYSAQLDALVRKYPQLYQRQSAGRCNLSFVPDVNKSFNRGFTDYFLDGKRSDVSSFLTPKNMGTPVGRVEKVSKNVLTVSGNSLLTNGDGLSYVDDSGRLRGFRVNKVTGNTRPRQGGISAVSGGTFLQTIEVFGTSFPSSMAGKSLFRNIDQSFLSAVLSDKGKRSIPIRLRFGIAPQGFRLTAEILHTGVECSLLLDMEHEKARSSQSENVRAQLSKWGNTVFCCQEVIVEDDFDYFIPSSKLSGLRRSMTEQLYSMLRHPMPASAGDRAEENGTEAPVTKVPLQDRYDPSSSYMYNAANSVSRAFYESQDIDADAYEIHPPKDALLMQCKHCIKYALGYCKKNGGKQSPWVEPLFLRLSDGRRFRLQFDCLRCKMNVLAYSLLMLLVFTFSSCYHGRQQTQGPSLGYNFIVRGDSMVLSCQSPDELPFDSVTIYPGDRVVVAEYITIESAGENTVWVKVARDQLTQGWIQEKVLLDNVDPDDPISQFISMFSSTKLLIVLALCVCGVAAYGLTLLDRRKAYIVHIRDISSVFPTLLVLSVATSATLYATIQHFAEEEWKHFFYYPSLNPFSLPLLLSLFLITIWAMAILAIAAVDDVIRKLPASDAVLYLCGLAAVCGVIYVAFTVSTLYYAGYVLLPVYAFFSLVRYRSHSYHRYFCGNCGAEMSHKGVCGQCGMMNK
ncbi:MAG: U32 family peptidase [Prevotella sp.]